MGYLEGLLIQKEPLEPHERADLKAWLETLEGDVEMFGDTAEDNRRMNTIRARLERNEESAP